MSELLNQYSCPKCGHEWHDVYDCMVNMDCPECGTKEITPCQSAELSGLDFTKTSGLKASDIDPAKFLLLMKVWGDVEFTNYILDGYDNFETEHNRKVMAKVFPSVGFRKQREDESNYDYLKEFEKYKDYCTVMLDKDDTYEPGEDCRPEDWDYEDDSVRIEDLSIPGDE